MTKNFILWYNKYMEKHKYSSSVAGFTIIEVSLVVAISFLLFVGVIGTTSVNISRQRYNDSVQSFADFLRRQYAEVISVENPRGAINNSEIGYLCTANSNNTITTKGVAGRTNCLIYGRLIVVGENNNFNLVHVYDILGDYSQPDTPLIGINLGALTRRPNGSSCQYALAGNSYTYNLAWDATLKTTSGTDFKGSILIIRQPNGNIGTLYYSGTALPISDAVGKATSVSLANCADPKKKIPSSNGQYNNLVSTSIKDGNFSSNEVQFCVASEDILTLGNRRRMVSLDKNGQNASAVAIFDQDSEGNKCNG